MNLGHCLTSKNKTYIVAEMSGNHGGSFEKATAIIDAAKRAGADAIKLQTYRPDTITIESNESDFKIPGSNPWSNRENLYKLYEKAFTPWEWHDDLFKYARALDLEVFSSPFDESAVDFLESLGCPHYKVASPEINHIPLLKYIANTRKPIILSCGVATKGDLTLALETLRNAGVEQIIVCQCTSAYPTPFSEMNISAIQRIQSEYCCIPGLSDHSPGSVAPILSVAYGAKFIEKHLVIDRKDETEDAFFSLDESEFTSMVQDVRNAELALGEPNVFAGQAKAENSWGKRSIYVSKNIEAGEIFTPENLKCVRPGYSLHPKHFDSLLGKAAKHNYGIGSRLDENELTT